MSLRSLIWKDLRLNRMILVMGATLFLAPFVIVAAAAWKEYWPGLPPVARWPYGLLPATLVSLGLSLLTLVTLAGNSIACERADRSAEFLAYLPPSRAAILASKVLVVLLPIAAVWAADLLLAWLMTPASGPASGGVGSVRETVLSLAPAAVMLFGAAMLGSAVLDSPAIATSLGIGATMAVIFALAMIGSMSGWAESELKRNAAIVFLSLGGMCFVVGCICYLRRVGP
jgi:ABC-type transport system involved in multi-copper enzyme maturation permease subunit